MFMVLIYAQLFLMYILNSIFGLPPKPKVMAKNTYFAFLSISSRFLDVMNYG